MRARTIIAGALVALAAFTAFDHGMRKDQASMCMRSDEVTCPQTLWWFGGGDAIAAVESPTGQRFAEPYPDEYHLVGWGCEGAGDKPLFRNEEDEFPACKRIEAF